MKTILFFPALYLIQTACLANPLSDLRYCSEQEREKFKQAVVFESIEAHPVKSDIYYYLGRTTWFGFGDFSNRTHLCSLIPETDEVEFRNETHADSDSAMLIRIDREGFISLAFFIKGDSPATDMNESDLRVIMDKTQNQVTGLVDKANGIIHASEEEVAAYLEEINFIADYLGITPGNKFKARMEMYQDSVGSKIKGDIVSGKINFPCLKSTMVKKVLKPISRGEQNNFKQLITSSALTKNKGNPNLPDPVMINGTFPYDSNQVSLTRVHVFRRDSVAKISLGYYLNSNFCFCSVELNIDSKGRHSAEKYYLNTEGEVSKFDNRKTTRDAAVAEQNQARVNEILKYFR